MKYADLVKDNVFALASAGLGTDLLTKMRQTGAKQLIEKAFQIELQ